MVSYAQNHEDVLLNRVFAGQPTGYYIDIGANDPTDASVTRHFYDRGWHGINVEPSRVAFRSLAAARRRDVNLNLGISDRRGTLRFYEAPTLSTHSTFSADEARAQRAQGIHFEEHLVPVITLAQLCEQYVSGPIDFMSIDVENHEWEVVQGGDWRRWRPRVVLVEDYVPATGIPGNHKWQHLLEGAGYHFALFDGINRFFVRDEDRQLLPRLSVPVNVLDDYVPHAYDLGPTALRVARWLDALPTRHPRLYAAARRFKRLTVAGVRTVLRPLRALRPGGRGAG
jgi:FkbM family methyltransferase